MPFIPAWVVTLASLAAAGTTVGESIYSATQGPPKLPTTPPPAPPTPNQLLQKNEMVAQQEPNVVGETSGLANPAYDSIISQILSGVLGTPGSSAAGANATGQQFTPVSNLPPAVVSGRTDLSDFVDRFVGGR